MDMWDNEDADWDTNSFSDISEKKVGLDGWVGKSGNAADRDSDGDDSDDDDGRCVAGCIWMLVCTRICTRICVCVWV